MRLMIIDDDPLVTSGLRTIITQESGQRNQLIDIVATGHNGIEAVDLYQAHQPDIVLMDIRMPDMDGISAGRQILSEFPEAKIIFLTTFSEDEYIMEALQIGSKGYLLKTDYHSLLPAIEAVSQGQLVFGQEIVSKFSQYPSQATQAPQIDLLTPQENDLVYLLAQGLNNKEIADKMFLTEGTVRNYLSKILDKLELRDRTQLAIYYYQVLDEANKQ